MSQWNLSVTPNVSERERKKESVTRTLCWRGKKLHQKLKKSKSKAWNSATVIESSIAIGPNTRHSPVFYNYGQTVHYYFCFFVSSHFVNWIQSVLLWKFQSSKYIKKRVRVNQLVDEEKNVEKSVQRRNSHRVYRTLGPFFLLFFISLLTHCYLNCNYGKKCWEKKNLKFIHFLSLSLSSKMKSGKGSYILYILFDLPN